MVSCVCYTQLMPRVSSLSPVTIIIPLFTVLFLTAIKDAIEDYVCVHAFLLLYYEIT